MEKDRKAAGEGEAKILTRAAVDSLYIYCDSSAIDWRALYEKAQDVDYGQSFEVNGLPFIKVQAWIKSFPLCVSHTQFMFFINRKASFVKVSSLAFEMRGFENTVAWLCRVLDRMKSQLVSVKWLECLRVNRLDVFCDFAYDGDFELDQFRTKLKRSGFFQSGENGEGKTIYFGSRSSMLVRLYVKSAEIEHSGKVYLKENWQAQGCEDSRIWRLEYEFHKDKLEELAGARELVNFDGGTIAKLFSYGVNSFEYVTESAEHRNLSRKPLHPIWQQLHEKFNVEYEIKPKRARAVDIDYRRKRAGKLVMGWLAAREIPFEDLPAQYVKDFLISRESYEKALNEIQIGAGAMRSPFENDLAEIEEDET